MEIVVVGVNHKVAPVQVREHLAFTPAQMESALAALREKTMEAVLLSTCNRTEIYAVVPSTESGVREVTNFLADFHAVPAERFAPYLFSLSGKEAVEHLFAVASGLDSMILGEPQILGQVREAYLAALAQDTAGTLLSWVFHHAMKVGKQVRTETNISRNAVSVSHAAVELAKGIFGTLADRSVLLVGAGEMGQLAARNLLDNGCAALVVANRTFSKAAELAARFGGTPAEFAQLPELLAQADVVISATGAPNFVITADMVGHALQSRPERPLILIDIAVPRDVDPRVKQFEQAVLHDIDDLQAVCTANLEERRKEVGHAQTIIAAELELFESWWGSLQVVPTIKALRDRAEAIRQMELQKALPRLGELTDRQRSVLEALTIGIVNKILHQPTVRLKSRGGNGTSANYVQILRDLFALEESKA
jgi:glutamyl-tRNA reductase